MKLNTLDYLIIAILAVSILLGYKRGLIRSLGGVISTVIGLSIAFLFRNSAADYLQEHYSVVSDITAILEKKLLNSAGITEQPVPVTTLPLVNEGITAIHRQITEFSYLLVAALCFLGLYIISSQLLKFSCLLLERMFGHGILGRINHGGGALIVFSQNTIIMAVLAGILISPLQLGTDIGIKSIGLAAHYMEGSVLVPYLVKIFAVIHGLIIKGA